MQDRVAAGKIEIWDTTVDLAEVQAVVKGLLHLLPAHAVQLLMAIFRIVVGRLIGSLGKS